METNRPLTPGGAAHILESAFFRRKVTFFGGLVLTGKAADFKSLALRQNRNADEAGGEVAERPKAIAC